VSDKICSPWCERNKQPILEVLRQVLPSSCTVLEVGSGSGQHGVYFAEHLPGVQWQPSDVDPVHLASICEWIAEVAPANLLPPVTLDVQWDDWGIAVVDVVFSANMLHITPWECSLGLLAGARRYLADNGLLLIYGPFRIGGEHTAVSNAEFDADLRSRNPRWGIRDLEEVCAAARGFDLEQRFPMPANNQTLVFRRC